MEGPIHSFWSCTELDRNKMRHVANIGLPPPQWSTWTVTFVVSPSPGYPLPLGGWCCVLVCRRSQVPSAVKMWKTSIWEPGDLLPVRADINADLDKPTVLPQGTWEQLLLSFTHCINWHPTLLVEGWILNGYAKIQPLTGEGTELSSMPKEHSWPSARHLPSQAWEGPLNCKQLLQTIC